MKYLATFILALALFTGLSGCNATTAAARPTSSIYVRLVGNSNNYYYLPANPNDGDEVQLTFDNNAWNTVDAGTNQLDAMGWSPVNKAWQPQAGAFSAFAQVYPAQKYSFLFHAPTHTWASNLMYNTD